MSDGDNRLRENRADIYGIGYPVERDDLARELTPSFVNRSLNDAEDTRHFLCVL